MPGTVVGSFTALDYSNRGTLYADLGRSAEALADYERAVAPDPTHAHAYANRGVTYAALGRFDDAQADYDHAITLDPTLALVYSNRGVTYRSLGRTDAARPTIPAPLNSTPGMP